MQIQQTEREFRYSGGLVLPDPDPSLGIEAVRQVYASSYPEIITASITAAIFCNRTHRDSVEMFEAKASDIKRGVRVLTR